MNQVAASIQEARAISANLKPSPPWQRLVADPDAQHPDPAVKCFRNDVYAVTIRRYKEGWPFNDGKWAVLGIHSHDGAPRHDWRDFQNIKNDLVGPDWEAIELYPAEERKLDPSNYYMLWCAPKIPIGMNTGRRICDATNCIAPQRGFA